MSTLTTTRSAPRRFTVQEAAAHGYGHPSTIRARIKSGRLPAERIDDRGTYWISEADLEQSDLVRFKPAGFTGESVEAAPAPVADLANDLEGLAVMAAQIVATWPRLSAERKAELGKLLAAT